MLIGSVFAPLFGVVLVDHFILRRRNAEGAVQALHGTALLAWLGGVSTYHLLANLYPDVGATLPSLILAGLLQYLLGRAFNRGRERVPA
ncbi:putative hydroxymethylpyrimidine transporter [compost metagenome]